MTTDSSEMRGIHSSELESTLQFMYLGERGSYVKRMGDFIKFAKK